MKLPSKNLTNKGLSPLLATAILISATVAGGALLYQYFTKSFSVYTSTGSIEIEASSFYISGDRFLVYYRVISRSDQPCNISRIYFLPHGSVPQISLGNATLYPGGVITGSQEFNVQRPAHLYAVAEYYVGGLRLETKPVEVIRG